MAGARPIKIGQRLALQWQSTCAQKACRHCSVGHSNSSMTGHGESWITETGDAQEIFHCRQTTLMLGEWKPL
jgi:hypothetical protein